jgi:hypothetical protein
MCPVRPSAAQHSYKFSSYTIKAFSLSGLVFPVHGFFYVRSLLNDPVSLFQLTVMYNVTRNQNIIGNGELVKHLEGSYHLGIRLEAEEDHNNNQ